MSSTLTVLRREIAERVGQVFPGMPVLAGKLEGPTERDVACVYPVGKQEDPDNTLEETAQLIVRVFLRFEDRLAPEKAIDPAPLEEIVDSLQSGLDDIQTQPGTHWYLRVTSARIDLDRRMVEAVVDARGWNLFRQA